MLLFLWGAMFNSVNYLFSRLKRQQGGIAALEFAIIAPVFFLVLLGCVEMGLFLMADAAVERAAHQLTREARIHYRGNCTGQMKAVLDTKLRGWGSVSKVEAKVLHKADADSPNTACGAGKDLVEYTLNVNKVGFIGVLNFLDFKPSRTIVVQNEPYDPEAP